MSRMECFGPESLSSSIVISESVLRAVISPQNTDASEARRRGVIAKIITLGR